MYQKSFQILNKIRKYFKNKNIFKTDDLKCNRAMVIPGKVFMIYWFYCRDSFIINKNQRGEV